MTLVDSGVQRVWIEGYDPRSEEDLSFLSNTVGSDYFTTLKIRLLAGREFEARDDEDVGTGGDCQRDAGAAVLG